MDEFYRSVIEQNVKQNKFWWALNLSMIVILALSALKII